MAEAQGHDGLLIAGGIGLAPLRPVLYQLLADRAQCGRIGLLYGARTPSVERNMECGTGLCGHCQIGPYFACKDGPVFRYDRIGALLNTTEVQSEMQTQVGGMEIRLIFSTWRSSKYE